MLANYAKCLAVHGDVEGLVEVVEMRMKDKGSRVSRDTQVLYNEVIGMLAEEGLRNKVVKKGRWEGRECLDVAVEVLEYMR